MDKRGSNDQTGDVGGLMTAPIYTQPENGGAALSNADSVEVIVTELTTTSATVEFLAATAGANEVHSINASSCA